MGACIACVGFCGVICYTSFGPDSVTFGVQSRCDNSVYDPSTSLKPSQQTIETKTRFAFSDFSVNQKEFKRKYNNDWNELREYVGLNDLEFIDNELVIINSNYKPEPEIFRIPGTDYFANYTVLRIMSGMGGLAFST